MISRRTLAVCKSNKSILDGLPQAERILDQSSDFTYSSHVVNGHGTPSCKKLISNIQREHQCDLHPGREPRSDRSHHSQIHP